MSRQPEHIIKTFLEYGIHIPTRTLILSGEVNEDMHLRVLCARKLLDAKNETITIELDSSGGYLYDGMAIYDTLRSFEGRVEIIGHGKIFSMASVILQAADTGGRILHPNSSVMVHFGYSSSPDDHPEQLARIAKEDKRIRNRVNRILYNAMGITQKQFTDRFQFDVYFDALQAVNEKLADKVLTVE